MPQGVSGAIKRRAVHKPFRELGGKGLIPLGWAVETGAGRLPFRVLIHVAGTNMICRSSERAIRGCVRSALTNAHERGYRAIAFPLIGAGGGGLPRERALEIMQDETRTVDDVGEVGAVLFRPAASWKAAHVIFEAGTRVMSMQQVLGEGNQASLPRCSIAQVWRLLAIAAAMLATLVKIPLAASWSVIFKL